MKQENMHSKFDIILNDDNVDDMYRDSTEQELLNTKKTFAPLNALKYVCQQPKDTYKYYPWVFSLMGIEISPKEVQLIMKLKFGDDVEVHCKQQLNSLFDGQLYFGGCKSLKIDDSPVVKSIEENKENLKRLGEEIMENIKYIYKSLKNIVFYQYDTITQSNVIDFCDKIMTKGDLEGISWQCVNGEKRKYWMSYLKTRITVKLVEAKDMPKPYIPKPYESKKSYESKETDTELLGCYFSKTMEILLCPKRIKNASNNLYNNLKPEDKTNISQDYCEQVIFAMVLIHEFAHAILDPTNLADKTISKPVFDYNIDDELSFFIEESLANMIMLRYFDASFKEESKELLIVKKFVESQSEAYKFGQNMYDANDVDWSLWRDKKSILSQKTNQQKCLMDLKKANTDDLKNVYEQLFLDEPGE